MVRFILGRVLAAVPVLLGVTIAVFFVMKLMPGDAIMARLGTEATPELIAAFRDLYGLDRPLPQQLWEWLGRVVRLDFGVSMVSRRPVLASILQRLPATLELTLAATLLALLIGIPLGVAAAWWKGRAADLVARFFAMIGQSVPSFWLALLLILLFALRLRWLPATGYVSLAEDPVRHLRHVALPALTLGIGMAAVVARYVRASLLDVLRRDYVRTARGKGLAARGVLWRHAVRNALIPVTTVVGIQIGTLIGGTVIIEDIFAWPGMGRFALQAIYERDYPVIQTIVIVIAAFYVTINLIVDLAYTFLDPKIRSDGRRDT
jgi:peptide/nickel transport system permease protein